MVPHNANARQSVKLKESSTDDDIQISTDTGEVTNIDESQINNINDYDDDYIDEEKAEKARSIYGLNNATNEIPMQQDLNCNNTVKSLILYYCGFNDQCLQHTFGCSTRNEFDKAAEELETDVEFQSPDLAEQNPWAAAGCELLISHDPSWAAETKEKIETQNNERNSQSLGQVCCQNKLIW